MASDAAYSAEIDWHGSCLRRLAMPTTPMNSRELRDTLAVLAGVCDHAARQYRAWAQRAQAVELRTVLLRRVEERAAAAAELQRQLDWLDGGAAAVAEPASAGRAMPLGQRRATPVSVPAPVSARPFVPPAPEGAPDDDIALLAECEACEVQAIDAYWQALEAPLPRRVRLLLQNQYAAVKRSHHRALVMRHLAPGRPDSVATPARAAPQLLLALAHPAAAPPHAASQAA